MGSASHDFRRPLCGLLEMHFILREGFQADFRNKKLGVLALPNGAGTNRLAIL